MERTTSKNEAKQILKGRWGNAIGAVLVFLVLFQLITFILSFIPIIGIIVSWILTEYFTLNFSKYCVKLSRDTCRIKYSECFLDVVTFFKIIGTEFLLGLLIAIPFLISGIIMVINTNNFLGIVAVLFIIIGFILCIYCGITFFTIPFIFIEEKEIGIIDSIKKAVNISKGFKWKYFVFILSFIGWYLLSIITLGIGFLWLTPYYVLASFLFYKKMLDNKAN